MQGQNGVRSKRSANKADRVVGGRGSGESRVGQIDDNVCAGTSLTEDSHSLESQSIGVALVHRSGRHKDESVGADNRIVRTIVCLVFRSKTPADRQRGSGDVGGVGWRTGEAEGVIVRRAAGQRRVGQRHEQVRAYCCLRERRHGSEIDIVPRERCDQTQGVRADGRVVRAIVGLVVRRERSADGQPELSHVETCRVGIVNAGGLRVESDDVVGARRSRHEVAEHDPAICIGREVGCAARSKPVGTNGGTNTDAVADRVGVLIVNDKSRESRHGGSINAVRRLNRDLRARRGSCHDGEWGAGGADAVARGVH